jgi:hypothetical protein
MKIDTNKQKDGYNKIFDMIAKSRDIRQLQKAVEASLPIIADYQLDEYQVQKLEEHGMKKYDSFLLSEMRMQRAMQSNRRA